MAVLEQSWVKVQEKTFGKWYAAWDEALGNMKEDILMACLRLNSKLQVRNISIKNLVTDLSDGVSTRKPTSAT